MTIEAVIFDIGNVLIEWQPERHYDARIGEAARRAMFEAIDLHGMNDRIDRGAPFRETVYETADANPAHREAVRLWHDEWIHMASPEIPHSLKLLRSLRQRGVPVYALSNFGIGSFAYALTKYPFLDEIDRRYISGHMGCIKPEARIFEMVEDDCGIAPERLLFTDGLAGDIANPPFHVARSR